MRKHFLIGVVAIGILGILGFGVWRGGRWLCHADPLRRDLLDQHYA
jgi:hypothetical protein